MASKGLIVGGLLAGAAIAAVGGYVLVEAIGSGDAQTENVDADFRPGGEEGATEAGDEAATLPGVVGESVFIKRPTLDMSRAVSQGTLTEADKLRRKREKVERTRRYLKLGFQGAWRGLSPFRVNESVIAQAEITVKGNDATGRLWVVTEFKPDGAQCTIVDMKEGRVVGNQLSFRAQGVAGQVTLNDSADVANGALGGRKVSLTRMPE